MTDTHESAGEQISAAEVRRPRPRPSSHNGRSRATPESVAAWTNALGGPRWDATAFTENPTPERYSESSRSPVRALLHARPHVTFKRCPACHTSKDVTAVGEDLRSAGFKYNCSNCWKIW